MEEIFSCLSLVQICLSFIAKIGEADLLNTALIDFSKVWCYIKFPFTRSIHMSELNEKAYENRIIMIVSRCLFCVGDCLMIVWSVQNDVCPFTSRNVAESPSAMLYWIISKENSIVVVEITLHCTYLNRKFVWSRY